MEHQVKAILARKVEVTRRRAGIKMLRHPSCPARPNLGRRNVPLHPRSLTEPQLSLDAVKQAVASALRRVVDSPAVQVVRRTEDISLVNPFASVPKGVTLNDGSIVVFSDGAESAVDVFRTVFHELFHRGSKARFRLLLKHSARVHQQSHFAGQASHPDHVPSGVCPRARGKSRCM